MKAIYPFLLILSLFSFIGATKANDEESMTPKQRRAAEIKTLKETDLITYGPKNPKGYVVVFTDFDCSYCRKLHSQIEELENLGIQLRYLAFPRQGLGSESYNKTVSIWCSDNRVSAMTQAMKGYSIESKVCQNPVNDHVKLGLKWGIQGTPTIVFADGTVRPGYLSAEKIAKEALSHGKMEAME